MKTPIRVLACGALCLAGILSSTPKAAEGPSGHWTFDRLDGESAPNSVAGGRPGVVHGAAEAAGAKDGALIFDGRDDYVALGDLGQFDAATIAFWMKGENVDKADDWQGLVTSDAWEEGVFHVGMRGGRIDVHWHLGGTRRGRLRSGPLKNNAWYHVAVLADRDRRIIRLLVNGHEDDAEDFFTELPRIELVAQVVGRESDDAGHARHFCGAIDDVRIYGRALTEPEIQRLCPGSKPLASHDGRHIRRGRRIPDEGYCDQPYVVVTKDGAWLCVLTTGKGHEGSPGQHFVATISENQGKTWGPLIDIEPADGPQASYGVPLIVPSGRVYAFYTYNGDRIDTLPDSERKIRADMLGWSCFKYSDDHGKTWSKRHRIPLPITACDRANQWKGEVQIFWGIDKPKVSDMGATFCITKLGKYMLDDGEGWMLHSDNILAETDPARINWRLLPDGEHGLRVPEFGSVQEEHNHVFIGPKQMYLVYRNKTGYPCHTYSDDGGRNWTEPVHMTYTPDGRRIKNPRACPKLWRCRNGKYLFWFHNHSGKTFFGRNPVWLAGGVVRDGKMHWSEPEILLYHNDLGSRGMSYPDLIEQDGKYWVTETQKTVARVHEIDPELLEGLWAQHEGKGRVAEAGLALSIEKQMTQADQVEMPRLPDLSSGGGFAIDVWLESGDLKAGGVILDSRDDQGRGVAMEVAEKGSLRLLFSDGKNKAGAWTSDPGLLRSGQSRHVTAIVDGGPNIITFLVDGKLCDGGQSRQYGWGRFDPKIGDVNGSDLLRLSPSFRGAIRSLRIYDRMLRTSEAVSNHHADLARDAAGSKIK